MILSCNMEDSLFTRNKDIISFCILMNGNIVTKLTQSSIKFKKLNHSNPCVI